MNASSRNQSWPPRASIDALRLRAKLYSSIREFFAQRDVLEVDTPSLSFATTTDPNIHSFTTEYLHTGDSSGQVLYLITSPEFHMKRLLAAGSGSIYQLCHVFRQSELGTQHNPEFTMLEWYRVGMGYQELMKEVAELVTMLLSHELNEPEYLTYQEAFQRHAGIDPLTTAFEDLKQLAQQAGLSISVDSQDDKDLYLDFLMSHLVQPRLGAGRLSFVYEYPASQCALARIAPQNAQVAERFELFVEGTELANGFHELADSDEQLRRFHAEQHKRELLGITSVNMDQNLIDALHTGLPDCSGVALGVDRLIQFIGIKESLNDVLAFPFNHA
jgi:lysyl-tRNA synthetase class 2